MKEAPAEHVMLLVGDCSLTEFVAETMEFLPGASRPHADGHEFIVSKKPRTVCVRPGDLTWFGPLSWHRGRPANKQGWRHFLRVTGSNHYTPVNELRTQTQVYLLDEGAGW